MLTKFRLETYFLSACTKGLTVFRRTRHMQAFPTIFSVSEVKNNDCVLSVDEK